MMPQKEVSEAIYQPADPVYGSYEGAQSSSARQQYETSYEQEVREGSSGKVYPLPHDRYAAFRPGPDCSGVAAAVWPALHVCSRWDIRSGSRATWVASGQTGLRV